MDTMMIDNIGPRRLSFTLTEEEAFQDPPPRRTLCPRYEDCLELAIENYWTSFTCRGCFLEELILTGRMKELDPPQIRFRVIVPDYPMYMDPVPYD